MPSLRAARNPRRSSSRLSGTVPALNNQPLSSSASQECVIVWPPQANDRRRVVDMLNDSWKNPWKITSLALVLVGATALATGLVVANRSGKDADKKPVEVSSSQARTASRATDSAAAPTAPRASTARATTATSTAPVASTAPSALTPPAVPTQAAIEACNHYAATESGQRDKTVDTVTDAGIGAVAGAVLGAAGGAIAGGGAGGGTLYGLNENKKHDERYREAYAACMRGRGYTG